MTWTLIPFFIASLSLGVLIGHDIGRRKAGHSKGSALDQDFPQTETSPTEERWKL